MNLTEEEVQCFLQAHDPNGNWLHENDVNHLYNTLNEWLYDFENTHRARFYIYCLGRRIFKSA